MSAAVDDGAAVDDDAADDDDDDAVADEDDDEDDDEEDDDLAVLKTTTIPLVVDTANLSGLAGWNAKSVAVKLLLVPCPMPKLHVEVIWSPSTRKI